MRKLFAILLIVVFGMSMYGCAKVPPGHVGVQVHMLGSNKGVDHETKPTGLYWRGMNTQWYYFPTFTKNYVWTRTKEEGSPTNEELTFQTVEGMSITADVGISFHIDPTKVGIVFQKYREGIDEITHVYLRNMVRDAFVEQCSILPIETVYGIGKTKMVDDVENIVRKQCEPIGIVVENIYLIGDLRLPDSIVAALNDKIAATQRAQQRENEVREAEAQAAKDVAAANGKAQAILVEAQAQAEANQLLAKSLTQNVINYKAIQTWNGQLPQYSGSGTVPFLNLNPSK